MPELLYGYAVNTGANAINDPNIIGGMNKIKPVAQSDWYIKHMLYTFNIEHEALRELRHSHKPGLFVGPKIVLLGGA